MNLGKLIIKGAASQFGREFGRAGANKILKGSNYYGVKNVDNDYEGRIKPSDSNIVKTIKEIKISDKELTDIINDVEEIANYLMTLLILFHKKQFDKIHIDHKNLILSCLSNQNKRIIHGI